MTAQLRAGLRDAWRVRGRTVVFVLMAALGTALLATGLSELGTSMANVQAARDAGARGMTYFRVHYLTESPFEASPALVRTLEQEVVPGGSAATMVRYNHTVRPTFPYPVLVVVGDVERVLGLPPVPVGSALVGAEVDLYDDGDTLDLGTTSASVVGRLPDGASVFDPWQGDQSLEGTVVLRLDLADVAANGWTAHEEAVARTMLLEPDAALVDELVSGAWESGLQLLPTELAKAHGATFASHQRDSVLYTTTYAAFLLLVVLAVGSSAAAMARRSRRSLAIQRLHGARLSDVALRLATYLAVTTFFPVLLVLVAAVPVLPGLRPVAPWAVVVVLLVHVALVSRVVSVVARDDLAAQLGGSDR